MLLTKKISAFFVGAVAVATSGPLTVYLTSKSVIPNKYNNEKYKAVDYEFSWDSDDEDGKWTVAPKPFKVNKHLARFKNNDHLTSYLVTEIPVFKEKAEGFAKFWDDMAEERSKSEKKESFFV